MKKTEPRPTPSSLCRSINMAIHEYAARHNGERPEQITMTLPVYTRIMQSVTVCHRTGMTMAFGIPIVVTAGEGYHVHLAGPDIPLYEIPGDFRQVYLPPDYAKREG